MRIREVIAAINRGDTSAFDSLSPNEKEAVFMILNQYRDLGYSPDLDRLWDRDFKNRPVDIDTFLDDDYYLGKVGKSLFPVWREELRDVMNPAAEIGEWIMTGSIGTGKTTIACVAIAYKIYFLTSFRNPQLFYKLVEGSPIIFGLFNILKYLALDTSYIYLTSWIKNLSPYFRDLKKDTEDTNYLGLPNNIGIAIGANAIHALGQNLYGGLPLAGETQIALLNGTNPRIEDLVGKEFWVYGREDGKIVPAIATAFCSGKRKLYQVELDNGEILRCSAEHLWMLRDESYVETEYLLPGQSLMPFVRRPNENGYEEVLDSDGWKKTHQMVGMDIYGDRLYCSPVAGQGPWVLHHEDLNKSNNDPTNLRKMTFKDHAHLHNTLCDLMHAPGVHEKSRETLRRIWEANPEMYEERCRISSETLKRSWETYGKMGVSAVGMTASHRQTMREHMTRLNRSEEGRERSRVKLVEFNKSIRERLDKSPRLRAIYEARGRALGVAHGPKNLTEYNLSRRLSIEFSDIEEAAINVVSACGKLTMSRLVKRLGVSRSVVDRRLREAGVTYAELKRDLNHKVVSVTLTDDVEDVYCLSVPRTRNYALTAGVFHHNCDEANFGKAHSISEADKSQIQDLYRATRRRMDSRFMQAGGSNPGLLCLVSSSRDQTDFLEDHIEASEGDPHVYISRHALYDVKGDYADSPRFKVVVGNQRYKSFIPKDDSEIPEDAQVVEVPEEFRRAFEDDVDDALRDIAGVSTYGVNLFIPRRDRIMECIDTSTPREHPFVDDSVTLSLDDDYGLVDAFVRERALRIYDKFTSKSKPLFFPDAPRFIHVDLAKNNDAAGMAMGCISDMKVVERVAVDGTVYRVTDYIVFIDFAIEIVAAKGSEIDFSKIRRFIFFLDQMGYQIEEVSYDSFESADSMQTLKKAEFLVAYLSMDRTTEGYDTMKSVIMELRLDMYEYLPFIRQTSRLEKIIVNGRKKIDHPADGKKDVSDAVGGVVFKCMKSMTAGRRKTDVDAILATHQKDKKRPQEHWIAKGYQTGNPLESLFEDD